MPNFSVSCSRDQTILISNLGISPSKAFQIGLDTIKEGGIDIIKQVKEQKELIDIKDMKITTLEKRVTNLSEELSVTRQKYAEVYKEHENCKLKLLTDSKKE